MTVQSNYSVMTTKCYGASDIKCDYSALDKQKKVDVLALYLSGTKENERSSSDDVKAVTSSIGEDIETDEERISDEITIATLIEKAKNEATILQDKLSNAKKAPYSYLANDGIIDYKGIIYTCDFKHNMLCLGDVSNPNKCLSIPLSSGGSLMVNKDSIGQLAKSISMFSPEDINRIITAIMIDKKCKEVELQVEEDGNVGVSVEDKVNNGDNNKISNEIDNEINYEKIDDLIKDSSMCSYTTDKEEDRMWYITSYTKDGITCKGGKAGCMVTLWSISYTDEKQFEEVSSFLETFSQYSNMTFASHLNFWKDYLHGSIDKNEFIDFYNETNNGIPDYTKMVGDSMFIDEEKIKFADYFNPLGGFMVSK